MIYRVSVVGPLPDVRGPLGTRQYWELRQASLRGARIHADLAMRGGDWTRIGDDGFWRPDVRLQFRTQDDAIVLVHYAGLVEQNDAFRDAAQAGRETSFETSYMRIALQFETGAERYRWLTQHLFVAKGRLLSTYELEYEVYRID